jgi:RHS repeat-associated protein
MDYFGARYYLNQIGRFSSADEKTEDVSFEDSSDNPMPYADLFDPQSLNRYTYALNNPLKYVDPDGHSATAADGLRLGLGIILTGAKVTGISVVAATVGAGALVAAGGAVLSHRVTEVQIANSHGEEKLSAITSIVSVENASNLVFSKANETIKAAGEVAKDLGARAKSGEFGSSGAKSNSEAAKHAKGLEGAAKNAEKLGAKLKEAGGKERAQVQKELEKVVKDIQGHLKEIGQKWPTK